MNQPENLNELDTSLVEAWNEPEKLPVIIEWLSRDRSEAAKAQYGYIVLKKHFNREHLSLRKDSLPFSWYSLGWSLYLNIDEFVRHEKHTEMLTAMFVELVNFCEMASGEYFAYTLKELLQHHFSGWSLSDSKIAPILPAKARAQFDEIKRMLEEEHDDYMERLDRMYY